MAPLYRTAPISDVPQADFLNTVVLADLPVIDAPDPLEILSQIKSLERLAGRRGGERDGPRPLDIDLLLFGDLVRVTTQRPPESTVAQPGDLTLPHPRMRDRRFVLAPLADLTPELRLPPDGAMVRDLLAALGDRQRVERIAWRRG